MIAYKRYAVWCLDRLIDTVLYIADKLGDVICVIQDSCQHTDTTVKEVREVSANDRAVVLQKHFCNKCGCVSWWGDPE